MGETLAIGDLQIRAVPAEHDRSRAPFGASADPVGYVVSGSKSIYFAGDTDLFDGMSELGPVDVGLIPIWGWGPGLGGGGHLDPERGGRGRRARSSRARSSRSTGARTSRSISDWPGSPPSSISRPLEFVGGARRATAPDVELRVLRVGDESLDF